ncbi:MAG: sigma-70 family RNA polymerase sigma factor [Pseudomonadota bacterium]|nr:MAG: sigma-70 family RNA polymerase sigma factor [Pseudomonadota bacterium]
MNQFGKQLTEYIPRLRRYARALFRGDSTAADDLVQDCLERALDRQHYFRANSNLRAWLFTIMHNIYVNRVRRQANVPDIVAAEPDSLPASSRPEDAVALDDLSRAIQALPHEQKTVLLLVTLEGMSYREVADMLEVPEGTVMSRLARARQRLRAGLSGHRETPLRRVK